LGGISLLELLDKKSSPAKNQYNILLYNIIALFRSDTNYESINWTIVFAIATAHLQDFEEFAKAINKHHG